MDASEKDTLLQFMGQVYGETKKNDQLVVGQSQQLQPRANVVKQEFEKVLRSQAGAPQRQPVPVQPPQATQAPQPTQVGQPSSVVTPEQAARELAQVELAQIELTQPVPSQPTGELAPVDPNQLEFDLSEPSKVDRVIELLETNNKLLVEIRDNTIKSNYNAKRAKNKKPQ